MYGQLSLRQSPPFSVPARFFLTAPVFGVFAALILLFTGDPLLASRWTPGMLAVTHCLVLGFFTTVMIGATQQLLPVVAGSIIQRPRFFSTLIYLQWVPGVSLLIYAFLHPASTVFIVAISLICGAILTFVSIILYSLQRSQSGNESVPGIKLAVMSLFFTLIMGITLALGYSGMLPLWRPALTNLHLSWGLIGWIAVMIMAIATQVVPMFQITPPYPAWMRKYFTPVMLALLLLKTALLWPGPDAVKLYIEPAIEVIIALCLCSFAITTLKMQNRARRRIKDNHRNFWRLGMVNLVSVAPLWIISMIAADPRLHLLTAAVFLLGFAMAVVTGMLLKIVSFLIWLHLAALNDNLRRDGKPGFGVPKMRAVIPPGKGDALLTLLVLAELTLIAAFFAPAYLATVAALLWLCQFSLLAYVLGYACYRYYRLRGRIHRAVGSRS